MRPKEKQIRLEMARNRRTPIVILRCCHPSSRIAWIHEPDERKEKDIQPEAVQSGFNGAPAAAIGDKGCAIFFEHSSGFVALSDPNGAKIRRFREAPKARRASGLVPKPLN